MGLRYSNAYHAILKGDIIGDRIEFRPTKTDPEFSIAGRTVGSMFFRTRQVLHRGDAVEDAVKLSRSWVDCQVDDIEQLQQRCGTADFGL